MAKIKTAKRKPKTSSVTFVYFKEVFSIILVRFLQILLSFEDHKRRMNGRQKSAFNSLIYSLQRAIEAFTETSKVSHKSRKGRKSIKK